MGNFASARSVTFVDVETTHLDSSRSAILQIAIITDREGRKDVWTTKIKPRSVELEFASKQALEICNFNEELLNIKQAKQAQVDSLDETRLIDGTP